MSSITPTQQARSGKTDETLDFSRKEKAFHFKDP
jgi:hypothetical protein